MTNKFLPATHEHKLVVYKPKSDKDVMRVRTAFLEQADKLHIMADLLGCMSPILKGGGFDIERLMIEGKLDNLEIVGIGCCRACVDKFIASLEDALAISKDLVAMLDKAKPEEVV